MKEKRAEIVRGTLWDKFCSCILRIINKRTKYIYIKKTFQMIISKWVNVIIIIIITMVDHCYYCSRWGRNGTHAGTDGRGNSCLIKSAESIPASRRLHFNNIRESRWLQLQLSRRKNTSKTRLIRAYGLSLSLPPSLRPSLSLSLWFVLNGRKSSDRLSLFFFYSSFTSICSSSGCDHKLSGFCLFLLFFFFF